MKKKFLGRVLTMLLVASMVFTLLPAPAIAAGNWWWNNDEYTEEAVPTATTDDYNRILHLDCGRKYFTKDWIIALMTEAKAAGYNQVQLAFGNKGLRFLLKDMSVLSYTDKQVRDAIQEGNKAYFNAGTANELTQADMDDILAAAAALELDVIPLFNTPFHMEAVITAMEELGITDSYFTKADGTQERGCLNLSNEDAVNFVKALMQKYVNYFSGKNCKYFAFGADEYTGGWNDTFYSYAGEIASMIKTAGMTPRVFNDSYRSGSTTYIDGVNQVCYWYTGYSGNMYSSAATLKAAGKHLINTNKDYYYVVSKNQITEWNSTQIQYVFSGPYDEATWIDKANEFDRNTFNNWANINRTSVISDGSMFCIWCDNPGAKDETQIAKETRMILRVMAARMQNSNAYQGTDVLVDGGFDANGQIYHADGQIHDKNINVTVGQQHTEMINGKNLGPYEGINTSIATVTGKVISGTTATQTLGDMVDLYSGKINSAEGVISDGNGNYLKVSGESLTNTTKIEEATKFTVEKTLTDEFTIQVAGTNKYLKLANKNGGANGIAVVEEQFKWIVGTDSNFCWQNGYNSYYYIVYNGEYWTSSNSWLNSGFLYAVKTETTSTATQTELTFTGVAPGNTEVTIGTTRYLIHVSEAQLNDNRICINYYITNHKVEDENGNTSRWVSANEAGINNEKGVAIEELIALTGTDTFTKKPAKFYKATAQSGNNIQTDAGWTNKIAAGDNCAKLRYWNNTWSVCDASGLWHEVSGKTAEYNPDTQREASAYGKNDGYAAITAYYGQRTDVTDEITTYATDWGEDITTSQSNKNIKPLGDTYALLDFAVKYQTGDRTPTQFTNAKTIVYNAVGNDDYQYSQDGNTRIVKDLFVENSDGYEVYMITVTKCSEKLTTDAKNLYALPAVTYAEENEKVVWVDKETDLGDFAPADKQYPGYKVGGDPIVSAIYVAQQSAYLVTYYVRAVSKDQLQVNYIDLATNKPFYHYGINVRGTTTFSEDIALNRDTPDSWKGDLVNGTVTNDKNKNQAVSADLSTMPEIGAEYRHVAYTCDHIQLSADQKTLDLYYKFNNTVTFVADFGLPITINKGDLSETLNNAGVEITEVKAAGVNHGAVEINEDVVTYTPDKRFVADENGESFTLTYTGTNVQETGSEGKVAYRVNILHASNVLYEENFLTQSGDSGLGWTEGTSVAPTTPQQTQKAKANGNVFGYDAAYVPSDTNPVTGELGVWTATGLEFSKMTKALTTEFYGNGFDLIGNCGPTTGRVMIAFTKQGANVPCRVVMVNTRFNDSSVATTLYQVPWAHVELGSDDAMYKVEIFASGNETNNSNRTMLASGYAAETDAFDSILAAYGMSASDVEYINVADTITVPSAYAVSYASVAADVTADQTIEVDGFRVYRSTNNANYPDNEKNVTYNNILDVVKGEITAYTENGNGGAAQVTEYEKNGGPQNEIYLDRGQSVTFQVGTASSTIQVSLRAVNGTTSWATSETGGNPASITSNTEMYYPVTTNTDGSITIANRGEALLAIGNVKLSAGAVTQSASEMDKDVVLASVRMALGASGEGDTFDPAISAKVTTTRFIRSKVVTLTVSASADVEKLMVNGVELRPTNSWLVKMGWSDTYTYILTEKVQKNEIKTYEIVGYRADGAASAPIVVKSK